ncbi:MAG: DUF2442 domain-containing protein [Magnetococcus sp. DMHC-8]
MLIDVIHVEVQEACRLLVTFENGERRLFDLSPYLNVGVFRCLRDVGLFRAAYVDGGTVTWPGGIDIAPETLHAESIPLPHG